MWNLETARRLDAWYTSPVGAFALAQENRMFQTLVSPWPRRGHTLLDVGCGTGVFLDMLWHHGFDVTGFDNNTEMLDVARERMGNRADFQLGQADHLPFDDNSFDYAALLSVLAYVKNPEKVLTEAIRVAERGVIVGFLNRFSSYALLEGRFPRTPPDSRRRGRWLNLWSLSRMARRICPECRITARSVLFGPPSTWRDSRIWGRINSLQSSIALGAYVGVRIDTQPQVPLTPLLLKAREHALAVYSGLQPETSREGTFPDDHRATERNTPDSETNSRIRCTGRKQS